MHEKFAGFKGRKMHLVKVIVQWKDKVRIKSFHQGRKSIKIMKKLKCLDFNYSEN